MLRCGSQQRISFYQHARSPSSVDLVNAQYIPAQPCRAQVTAYWMHAALKPTSSQPRAVAKKCHFTEDKIVLRKPGRKACHAQSENSLLGQHESKYNTVVWDTVRSAQPKTRRGSGHRRWRSTLELSQDEAETPSEQPFISLTSVPSSEYPLDGYAHPMAGESESSLSEAEMPGSSSLSSDSDESGGLVWPQQLRPLRHKAFMKIRMSHALKKKILRFRSGSLKVMTTVRAKHKLNSDF
ncbi:dapper homolog 3-like [Garra rufa]|uniref:dapper homolog 3-like n=1 Tax=Garra rufa TaxID=137080 RepID=UPI003CCEC7C3